MPAGDGLVARFAAGERVSRWLRAALWPAGLDARAGRLVSVALSVAIVGDAHDDGFVLKPLSTTRRQEKATRTHDARIVHSAPQSRKYFVWFFNGVFI